MKKVNPYLSNGASIFISIVAALQSRVWQREIKPRADRKKGSSRCLSGRGRKGQASIYGVSVATPQTQVLSPARVRGGGGTVRQSGLCACKLGLLAPRFRHLPDGRQEWTGHLVDGVGLFLLILREDRQTNKTPCFRPDKLRKNKSPGLPRTWTHALSRRCSSPALRHHIPIQQQ